MAIIIIIVVVIFIIIIIVISLDIWGLTTLWNAQNPPPSPKDESCT